MKGATVLGLVLWLLPAIGAAQLPTSSPMPELRLDLIAGGRPAAQIGAGVQLPAGAYVRVGIDGAAGVSLAGSGSRAGRADGRLDLLTRFLLDPFRQRAYGLSVGGGVSLRAEPGDRVRPLLLVALEVEGRRGAGGWAPALQLGLGGGARIGLIVRRGARQAR